MGLRWTDTIDIAIELTEAHPDVIRNGFVLLIYMHGFVHYQTLVMTQISRRRFA
jgi:Fe-S-cluster formation regulator IscX/YfhJ